LLNKSPSQPFSANSSLNLMGMKFRGLTIFKPVLHQVQMVQNTHSFLRHSKVQLLKCLNMLIYYNYVFLKTSSRSIYLLFCFFSIIKIHECFKKYRTV